MWFYKYVLPILLLVNIIVYGRNAYDRFKRNKKKSGIAWGLSAIFWTAILIIRLYYGVI